MEWIVKFHDKFEQEFDELSKEVQDELLAHALLLETIGPALGSKYTNMKELRFKADNGIWRVAFAFDPKRNAILLMAGNKAGVSEKHFYKKLIKKADDRFASYLSN